MFNHLTRLADFTNFNSIKQIASFMSAMDDFNKCIEKLEDAKLNSDEERDTRDNNSIEMPIPFKERSGKRLIMLIVLPMGWDEPLLDKDSPEAVQFGKHNSLKSTGSFNGKNLLTGEALELSLGGSDMTRDDVGDRDTEYFYDISRLCTQYDEADNKWERLWAEVDKLKIDKVYAKATRDGLFRHLGLINSLKASKADKVSNDYVARKLHGKRREIFSMTLLRALPVYTNKEEMQKHRKKGHYDYFV
jgi:hypothetical protein